MMPKLKGSRYEEHDQPAEVAEVFATWAGVCAKVASHYDGSLALVGGTRPRYLKAARYDQAARAWWAGARAAAASDARLRPVVASPARSRVMKVELVHYDEHAPILYSSRVERFQPARVEEWRRQGFEVVRAWWITVEADGFSHYGDPAGLEVAAAREAEDRRRPGLVLDGREESDHGLDDEADYLVGWDGS